MAEENEQDDTVLDLTDEVEDQTQETGEAQEAETPEEFQIELEGEEAVDNEPAWAKDLRQKYREQSRELDQYRKRDQAKIEVGKKPTLEDCDWDQDKFETEYEQWTQRKAQADQAEQNAAQQQAIRNEEFNRNLGKYRAAAAALPVQDFEQAEQAIRAALPDIYQSAIVTYAKDPAKVVYALWKHPSKLAALAAEPDGGRFLLAINDMERNLKVTTRKAPPPPMSENVQRGSASVATNVDKKAEKMAEEAARDPTKFRAYREYMKSKNA